MKPKKTTDKMPKPPRGEIKVSPNVKVIPGKMGQSVRASSVNEKLASGADKAKAENARSIVKTAAAKKALKNVNNPKKSSTDPRGKANVKALKAANKPTNKTGSAMNKLERKYFNKLSATEQKKMLKGLQDIERAGLSKTTRNTTKGSTMKKVPNRGGGRLRMGGGGVGAGGLGINDMNR
jgi:hypothetical protein